MLCTTVPASPTRHWQGFPGILESREYLPASACLERDPVEFLPDTALVQIVASAPLHARLALRCCSHAWRAVVSTCQDTVVLSPQCDDKDRLSLPLTDTVFPCAKSVKLQPGFFLQRKQLAQLASSSRSFLVNIRSFSLEASSFRLAADPCLISALFSSLPQLATLQIGNLNALTHTTSSKLTHFYRIVQNSSSQPISDEELYNIPSYQTTVLSTILSLLPTLHRLTHLALLEILPTTNPALLTLSTLRSLSSLHLATSPSYTPALVSSILSPLTSLLHLEIHHLTFPLPPLPPSPSPPSPILATSTLTRLTHLSIHSPPHHGDLPQWTVPLQHLPSLASLNIPFISSLKWLPNMTALTNLEALRVVMEPTDMPLLAATTSLRRMVLNLDRASAAGLPLLTSLRGLQELVIGYRDHDYDWMRPLGLFTSLTCLRVYQSDPPANAHTPPRHAPPVNSALAPSAPAPTPPPPHPTSSAPPPCPPPRRSAPTPPAPSSRPSHACPTPPPLFRSSPRHSRGGSAPSRLAPPAPPRTPAHSFPSLPNLRTPSRHHPTTPAPFTPQPLPPKTPHPLSSWSALKSLEALSFFTPLPLSHTSLSLLPSLRTLHTNTLPAATFLNKPPLHLVTLALTTLPTPNLPLILPTTPALTTLSLVNPTLSDLHSLAHNCPHITHLALHFNNRAPPLPPTALHALYRLPHLEQLTLADPRPLPAHLELLGPPTARPLLQSLVALTHIHLYNLNPLRRALVASTCKEVLAQLRRPHVRVNYPTT